MAGEFFAAVDARHRRRCAPVRRSQPRGAAAASRPVPAARHPAPRPAGRGGATADADAALDLATAPGFARGGARRCVCWRWPAWPSASRSGRARSRGALMRAFTAAAVQVAPVPGPLTADVVAREPRQVRRLDPPLRRGHRRRAGRAARVGDDRLHPRLLDRGAVGPGSELPGPVIEPMQRRRRASSASTSCFGTYERGPERGVVYNAVGAHRPARRGARGLPQDPPVLHRDRRRRRLGDARATRSRCATPSSAGSA